MTRSDLIPSKNFCLSEIIQKVAQWRVPGKKIAFTNGVFDILHEGHIFSLSQAASTADYLIVGLNSDASVKRLKGNDRPVYNQESRALILASLVVVDAVVLFEEDTPFQLITSIMPDVLVKGGDYTIEQIVGAKEVIANGGNVIINPVIQGFSTTAIIDQIRKSGSVGKT